MPDPQTANDILAAVLTLAGGPATAALIAGVIEIVKRLPRIGALIDAGREYVLSLVLSAGIIAYAAYATSYVLDAVSGFALFLAWYGLAQLAGSAYDTASAAKAKVMG